VLQQNPQEHSFKGAKRTVHQAVAKQVEHDHERSNNKIVLPQHRTQNDAES
jgi:hypothetical protein